MNLNFHAKIEGIFVILIHIEFYENLNFYTDQNSTFLTVWKSRVPNTLFCETSGKSQNQNQFWNFALNFYCLLKLKFEPKSQSSSLFSTFVLSSLGSIIINKQLSARCLKITEKVSFNIASYVYILSGQKLIKNAKNGPFWRVFENLKLAVKQCYQTGHFW